MVVSRLGREIWEGTNIVDSLTVNLQPPEHGDFPLCPPSLAKMATAFLAVEIPAVSTVLAHPQENKKGKAAQESNYALKLSLLMQITLNLKNKHPGLIFGSSFRDTQHGL